MENKKRICLICGITDRQTFMFPQRTSEEKKLLFDAWLKFAMESNPPEERLKMKYKRLCIMHFEDKYISEPYKQRKVRHALPTLLEATSKENGKLDTSMTDCLASDKGNFAREETDLPFKEFSVCEECSDDVENVSYSPESQTLLRENSINASPRSNFPQTLNGNQKINDPSIMKSILDKVRLKKKGSVFGLPLKRKCNLHKLTKDRLEHLIESMPTKDLNLKNRILKILQGKKIYKHLSPNGKGALGRAKHCLCTEHCKSNNYFPQIGVKIDGWNSSETSSEILDNSKHVFTVSALLSNIQDKVQIERLCQLLIESLYRLKKDNENGAMSKLEIFLSRDEISSASDRNMVTSEPLNGIEATDETANANSASNQVTSEIITDQNITSQEVHVTNPSLEISSQCPHSEIPVLPPPEKNENIINPPIDSKQHFKVDLNFFQEHNYISLDSQVLFENTPYIVNLTNSNTFKSSSKNTRIFKRPYIETSRKIQRELLKLRGQVGHLKKLLKKKNDNFQLMKKKVKYLGDMVRKEKGLKCIRYPKYIGSSDSEPLLRNEDRISEAEGSEKEGKSKKKLVLLPSSEFSTFDISNSVSTFKTSEVNLDKSLDYFYDSFLEDCIEEG